MMRDAFVCAAAEWTALASIFVVGYLDYVEEGECTIETRRQKR